MKSIHIIKILLLILLFPIIARSQTLHLVPIMSTDDKIIGPNAKVVLQKWITECSQIAQATGMNFKHRDYMVVGSDFSKQKALSVLSNMDVGSNDVIFSYIFTHGYRAVEQQSKYPNLQMVYKVTSAQVEQFEQNMLSSSYYFNKLQEKNARLTILVVEACNKETAIAEPDRGYGNAKIIAIEKELDVEQYRQLFNVRGTVIVASASPGEAANAPPSADESHFSENFRRQLKNMMSKQHQVSWEILLDKTRQATTSDVQQLYPGTVTVTQVPIYDVNVSANSNNNGNNNPTTDLSVNDQRYLQYMLQGVREYHAGQLQQAVANFRRALELKPNDRQAINNINVCQADSGALEFFNYNYESSCRTLTSMESQQSFTEQRYAYSQYALGILYLKGKGCSKNHQKAEYWLKTAAKNGVQGACRVLNRLGVYDCN
jgi:tetratricopeptide (TPR) repeat protein